MSVLFTLIALGLAIKIAASFLNIGLWLLKPVLGVAVLIMIFWPMIAQGGLA